MRQEPQTHEDLEAILRIAVAATADETPQSGNLRDQLLAAGRELGLSDDEIDLAEQRWREEKEQAALSQFKRKDRIAFGLLVAAAALVCAAVVALALNRAIDQDFGSIVPVVFGLGLWYHWTANFDARSAGFQRRFEAWRQRPE